MVHRTTHHKGRGALSNPGSRFGHTTAEDFDDGWGTLAEAADEAAPPATHLHHDPARRLISYNNSPDIPFSASINPYKGCSHGCVYCYARPTHEYLDHSPGLDFETEIYYKPEAATLFEAELRHPRYKCTAITLGANTDPYQPDDRHLAVTRSILEVANRFNQPISIVTKGAHITRDLDILGDMASRNLACVYVSLTTQDNELKRILEPHTASPTRRLRNIQALVQNGIPTGVLVAPIIPMITDSELETLVQAGADHGATRAGYVLLRLPHAIKTLFREWLVEHYPDRADHVMSLIRQMHGGADYQAGWGERMTGSGIHATLLADRFKLACQRAGINKRRFILEKTSFQVPPATGDQLGFKF